eukprot:9486565-Pyramimonas_sp.AAC.1
MQPRGPPRHVKTLPLGSPTSTRCPPERMTLSRDMPAMNSRACPASSMMSKATGAAFLRASADSRAAAIVLASLRSWVRKAGKSLEDPPSHGNLPWAMK